MDEEDPFDEALRDESAKLRPILDTLKAYLQSTFTCPDLNIAYAIDFEAGGVYHLRLQFIGDNEPSKVMAAAKAKMAELTPYRVEVGVLGPVVAL